MLTLTEIKSDPEIKVLMERTDKNMKFIGYTEHGYRHAKVVAKFCTSILNDMGLSQREVELGEIAAYLHDIGNSINRDFHAQSGACMAFNILNRKGMDYNEISEICAAIGNHHEEDGVPVSKIAAGLIIADKADVHRSRVRNLKQIRYDMHDRVNHAVTSSKVLVLEDKKIISLEIEVDTKIAPVIEYFEIFMSRMVLSQKAARALGAEFQLVINGTKLI